MAMYEEVKEFHSDFSYSRPMNITLNVMFMGLFVYFHKNSYFSTQKALSIARFLFYNVR